MKLSTSKSSPTSIWTRLTRRREHRLIDLLLGVFFLVMVVSWIGSLSPLLAAGVFAMGVGAYLASLARTERAGSPQSIASVAPVDPGHDAIGVLEKLLAEAPPIPLTDWVRVEPAEVTPLVNAVRAAADDSVRSGKADELARAILNERQVPLTGQLRVNRRRAQRLLADLRSG